jgi:D-sedoheptulose 7-phosphate isomerase
MDKLLKLIKRAREEKRNVFVCGNGGSSATAEHFTNDLFSRGVRAFCLNSNTSIMTMIANDFGYQFTFSKQIDLYAEPKDLLVTISCSGTSPNVVNAQVVAGLKGMDVYNFEVFKDGDKDYGKLEDKHLQLVHQIKDAL